MGRSVPISPKQDDTYLGVILGWLLRPSSNTQLINSQPRINNSLPFNHQLDTLKSPMRYFQYDTTNSIPKIQKSPLRYLQTQIHQNDTSNTIIRTRYQNFKNHFFDSFNSISSKTILSTRYLTPRYQKIKITISIFPTHSHQPQAIPITLCHQTTQNQRLVTHNANQPFRYPHLSNPKSPTRQHHRTPATLYHRLQLQNNYQNQPSGPPTSTNVGATITRQHQSQIITLTFIIPNPDQQLQSIHRNPNIYQRRSNHYKIKNVSQT